MWNFVATGVYALFNSHVEISTTRVCKTEGGGGSRAVFTVCKKTSVLVEDGFPYLGIWFHDSQKKFYFFRNWHFSCTFCHCPSEYLLSICISSAKCQISFVKKVTVKKTALNLSILKTRQHQTRQVQPGTARYSQVQPGTARQRCKNSNASLARTVIVCMISTAGLIFRYDSSSTLYPCESLGQSFELV